MRLRFWIALLLFFACAIVFVLFRPLTLNRKAERLKLRTNVSFDSVLNRLQAEKILKTAPELRITASLFGIDSLKAGSYVIEPSENLVGLLRRFHGSKQSPLKMTIGNERVRIRTITQFAAKMQRNDYTLADSSEWANFLGNADSLRPLGVNTHTVLTRMLPLSYEIYWSEPPRAVLHVFEKAWNKYWDASKKKKAERIGLTPTEVSILASIVEEETQHAPDRPLIASTYLNRLRIGMRLQADPTAKFASGDFGAKRVTAVHLRTVSPYNTYQVKGLPPGPICLPSLAAIEAVLEAPATEYLYFVASHRFDGTSVFAKDYDEHLRNAKRYQDELTRRLGN